MFSTGSSLKSQDGLKKERPVESSTAVVHDRTQSTYTGSVSLYQRSRDALMLKGDERRREHMENRDHMEPVLHVEGDMTSFGHQNYFKATSSHVDSCDDDTLESPNTGSTTESDHSGLYVPDNSLISTATESISPTKPCFDSFQVFPQSNVIVSTRPESVSDQEVETAIEVSQHDNHQQPPQPNSVQRILLREYIVPSRGYQEVVKIFLPYDIVSNYVELASRSQEDCLSTSMSDLSQKNNSTVQYLTDELDVISKRVKDLEEEKYSQSRELADLMKKLEDQSRCNDRQDATTGRLFSLSSSYVRGDMTHNSCGIDFPNHQCLKEIVTKDYEQAKIALHDMISILACYIGKDRKYSYRGKEVEYVLTYVLSPLQKLACFTAGQFIESKKDIFAQLDTHVDKINLKEWSIERAYWFKTTQKSVVEYLEKLDKENFLNSAMEKDKLILDDPHHGAWIKWFQNPVSKCRAGSVGDLFIIMLKHELFARISDPVCELRYAPNTKVPYRDYNCELLVLDPDYVLEKHPVNKKTYGDLRSSEQNVTVVLPGLYVTNSEGALECAVKTQVYHPVVNQTRSFFY